MTFKEEIEKKVWEGPSFEKGATFAAELILNEMGTWCREREDAAKMNSNNEDWCKGMQDLKEHIKSFIGTK